MPSQSGRRKYGERIGKLSLLYSLYTHPSPLQVLLGLSRDFYMERLEGREGVRQIIQ
jgi:hypothetical protein